MTKHTAKELNAKAAQALTDRGGGKSGIANRTSGHSKVRKGRERKGRGEDLN